MLGLMIRPLPELAGRFLPSFDVQEWMPLILAVVAGFPSYLFGLLATLMLLDERDRGLLPALRVTPMTDASLINAKILPALLLAAAGTPVALLLSGQASHLTPAGITAAALIAGPSAAFYALTGTALARNKVQGITAGKIMGTVLPAPVLLALLPEPWRWMSLIFPSTWIGAVFMDPGREWIWAGVGLVYTLMLALAAWTYGKKRYF
jgi:hypothetical protein